MLDALPGAHKAGRLDELLAQPPRLESRLARSWLPVELAFFADPQLLLFVGGMAIATFDLRLPGWCAGVGFAALALLPQVTDSQVAGVFVPALAVVLTMLSFSGGLKIFLAVAPCDLRKSFNGLHGLATGCEKDSSHRTFDDSVAF